MNIKYINLIISLSVIGSTILITNIIFAQNTTEMANIQYPIAELGNCGDKTVCKSYCDKTENMEPCLNFAEKNNLMSKKDVDTAKKFSTAENKGPGGCQGKEECESFCNDIDKIDECIGFAEKNDLMPPSELEEAKKVQSAIKRGVKPPACKNKKECDTYCGDSNHMEECVTFGMEAGFIQGKELEDAQKMLAALKRGIKPPPCRGKEDCDQYCQNPDNMEVCMNFAIEAGFMGEKEKVESQKMLMAIKKGVKPPSCRGKDECDQYCGQEEHFEECTNFAEAAGFMNAEEATMARKTKGKGPGDCKGKEECESFCGNPDNQETCFNFAKENGMMPEEDLKRMEDGKQQFKESLEQSPPEVMDCLNSLVGNEQMEKLKSGVAMPSRDIGEQMRTCFEKMMGDSQGSNKMMSPNQTGPDNCQNPEECEKFQPGPGVSNPAGQMMPQQSGPGGCKGPEECQTYCKDNPEECKNFNPSGDNDGQRRNMQNAPNISDRLEEMMPRGEEQSTMGRPSGCASPEECQQQGQQQNQMMTPPTICEGENCKQGFIPQQFEGQQPIWEGQQSSPPANGNIPFTSQPQNYPAFQEPSINQQPLMENIITPPSTENMIPPINTETPPMSNAPARKSLLESLLGTISVIFAQLLKR